MLVELSVTFRVLTQCMHLNILFADKLDGAFVLQIIDACTKLSLKVLILDEMLFPTQSFLTILNKSTSLQTLSLEGAQLLDMVSHQ